MTLTRCQRCHRRRCHRRHLCRRCAHDIATQAHERWLTHLADDGSAT